MRKLKSMGCKWLACTMVTRSGLTDTARRSRDHETRSNRASVLLLHAPVRLAISEEAGISLQFFPAHPRRPVFPGRWWQSAFGRGLRLVCNALAICRYIRRSAPARGGRR